MPTAVLKRLPLLRTSTLSLGTVAGAAAKAYGSRVAHLLHEPLPYDGLPPDAVRYSDVASFVQRGASVLAGPLGVRPGDRVVICPDNRIDFLWWTFACSAAGAVAVPVNPGSRSDELSWVVNDSGASCVITDSDIYRKAIGRRAAVPGVRTFGLCDALRPRRGFHALPALLAAASNDVQPRRAAPEDVAGIFYTSGTTGRAKGVVLSQKALMSMLSFMGLVPSVPRQLAVEALPLAHIMGFATGLLTFAAGVPTLHLPRFDAERVLDEIEAHKATAYIGVPTTYRRLEEAGAAERDLCSVRMWASAADVMPPDLMARFKSYGRSLAPLPAGAFFVEGYGMVELSGGAMLRVSLPGRTPASSGFVGFPLPGWKARIVSDDGQEAARGATGELELTGPGVHDGYLGDANATERMVRDGWLRTGDLAFRDRLGLVHFVGRKKEVVKSGGYSVYPAEVEALLREHPGVEDAVVFGLPDPMLGEVPCAAVVLAPGPTTADDVKAWAKGNMTRYKAPRHVVSVQPDELPMGPTRKVLRRELAHQLGSRIDPAD